MNMIMGSTTIIFIRDVINGCLFRVAKQEQLPRKLRHMRDVLGKGRITGLGTVSAMPL